MPECSVTNVYRKAEALAGEIRTRIVAGHYLPGQRLPSRNVMMTQYDVSKVTVQKALDRLDEEGFVFSVDRSGTYVAERSPHLTHYAMLFPQIEEMSKRNHIYRALAGAAKGFNRNFKIDLHYGFEGARGFQRYQSLAEDVKKHRVAGLLFATPPFVLRNTPLLDEPDIPRAAFMTPSPHLDIPAVRQDTEAFLRKVVEFVVNHGCRRVAVIQSTRQADRMKPVLQERFAAVEIGVLRNGFQGCDINAPNCTRDLTRLLMAGSPDQRPDCLIVTDDNLLPPVSDALAEMKLYPPDDLQLLAHCNFPWPTHSAVPAVRLGSCMRECIDAMMKHISDQQNKRTPLPVIELPAYFDFEYPGKLIDGKDGL